MDPFLGSGGPARARRGWSCGLIAAALAAGIASCQQDGRELAPPLWGGTGGTGGSGSGSGTGGGDLAFDAGGPTGPPDLDAGGLCGNVIHENITDPPNVYFVLDASGSMATPVAGGTRYQVVQAAVAKLVHDVSHLIRAGAAVFPLGATITDACHVGGEVFPPALDNPLGFDAATKNIMPSGGTPTAATLVALEPTLLALGGKTVVVLATDGGPNCNPKAACTASECMVNIEQCPQAGTCCDPGQNCCAPGAVGGPGDCIDHQAVVQAVADLAGAGVNVYVVGIPGSGAYSNVLADMAFAGKTAQLVAPFYYDVKNLGTLGAVLSTIAGGLLSCDFPLADPPMDPSQTNVYLDQKLLLADPVNGWSWSSPGVVTLHGSACAALKSGAVGQVQIVSGCPTMGAK
jgi:hypothetical protein